MRAQLSILLFLSIFVIVDAVYYYKKHAGFSSCANPTGTITLKTKEKTRDCGCWFSTSSTVNSFYNPTDSEFSGAVGCIADNCNTGGGMTWDNSNDCLSPKFTGNYIEMETASGQCYHFSCDPFPTPAPTKLPTTLTPTKLPTSPTLYPTRQPTKLPTLPTKSPTVTSLAPTIPSFMPTATPTQSTPTQVPTTLPTSSPTPCPECICTEVPTSLPTANPTTSVPTTEPTTSAPSTQPTRNPTTSSPTMEPTTSSPSATPSLSPTKLPTIFPTQRPNTKRPTNTMSPTGCEPGMVTCCFTGNEEIFQLWIDMKDVTADIRGGALNKPDQAKWVEFKEPAGDAAFAVYGKEYEAKKTGSFMAQCTATRAGSAWDGLKLTAAGNASGWKSLYMLTDGFARGWYFTVFPGNLPRSGTALVDTSYTLNTDRCGAVDINDKIQPVQKRTLPDWSLRYVVQAAGGIDCGTGAPSVEDVGRRRRRRLGNKVQFKIDEMKIRFDALVEEKAALLKKITVESV